MIVDHIVRFLMSKSLHHGILKLYFFLGKGENMEHEEKLDSVQLEYLYLLQSQLASQKVHFEGIIERLEQQHHKEVQPSHS